MFLAIDSSLGTSVAVVSGDGTILAEASSDAIVVTQRTSVRLLRKPLRALVLNQPK